MTAVLKHELRSYFHSLAAYLFCAFFLCFVGIGAMLYNLKAAVANFEYVLQFVGIGMTVIIPVLTMKVISEEKKQKTDQLLYTLPLTGTEIVLGKFFALLIVFLIPMAIISVYPLIFAQYGDVCLQTSYGSLVGFFLMCAAMISIGTFISSLTDKQGFAAGITIPILLLNYFSVQLAENIPSDFLDGAIQTIVEKLCLFERFDTIVNGVFDLTAITFFITVTVFFLFLTVQSLEKRRYN